MYGYAKNQHETLRFHIYMAYGIGEYFPTSRYVLKSYNLGLHNSSLLFVTSNAHYYNDTKYLIRQNGAHCGWPLSIILNGDDGDDKN